MNPFSELGLPAPIEAAIAEKKFEQPTRVQAAVMDVGLRGRDLLVSSETGSGKTLAFGAVLARELLGEPAGGAGATATNPLGGAQTTPPRRGPHPRTPRALVIAPTRELAAQVRGELAWLFAQTGWRLGVFTGGTDVRGDLAVIKRGVDVVVGTPGRLVDLVSRRSLALETVEAVVLDEADEMLDMGFREDLERLLGQAAARRLTLMFSATLPPDILRLAARYQKDAARIDTRQSGAAPHADIHYVAYLTAMGEKLAAVMNILRVREARRAIVFGTTREGVASLHESLVQRGVRAVVLSGDRSQADRDRALAALKRGEARVLVATNVAARGLDLPEVDLVIHADLPSNVEALTHRSGRTGRAGRKGTSVLLAQVSERRKAERLMAAAKLRVPWQSAPDAEAVATHAEEVLCRELRRGLDAGGANGATAATGEVDATAGGEPSSADDRLATDAPLAEAPDTSARVAALLERLGKVDERGLLRALLAREIARLPVGDAVSTVALPSDEKRERVSGNTPVDRRARFAHGAVTFRINLGARNKAEPGWLLPLICRRGGITRQEVGAIRVGPDASEFQIAAEAANEFALAAALPDPRAPHVHIQPAGGRPAAEPRESRPAHGRRPDPRSGGRFGHAGPQPARPPVSPPSQKRPHAAPAPSFGPAAPTTPPRNDHAAKPAAVATAPARVEMATRRPSATPGDDHARASKRSRNVFPLKPFQAPRETRAERPRHGQPPRPADGSGQAFRRPSKPAPKHEARPRHQPAPKHESRPRPDSRPR